MGTMLAFAEGVLLKQLTDSVLPVHPEGRLKSLLFGIASLSILIGTAFLLYACYLFFTSTLAPHLAMASMALASFLVASIYIAVSFAVMAYKQKKLMDVKDQVVDLSETALALLEEELSEPIRDNPKTAVLLSGIAGLLAGERIPRN